MIFLGIDNGVSGSIGAISQDGSFTMFKKTPVFKEQDYTKKKKNISRLNWDAFCALIESLPDGKIIAGIERPMINSARFSASISAARCLEAQLIALSEFEGIRVEYLDSKEWQKLLLPKGVSGPELKKASAAIGCRLFPEHEELIRKHKDADGILIAEAMRRRFQ